MTLTELPIRDIPYTAIVDPSRAKARSERVEPICTKSKMLREDPRDVTPNIETTDPNLAKDRRLSELPRCTKSRTEMEEPRRDIP
jgi:hypothetical protein